MNSLAVLALIAVAICIAEGSRYGINSKEDNSRELYNRRTTTDKYDSRERSNADKSMNSRNRFAPDSRELFKPRSTFDSRDISRATLDSRDVSRQNKNSVENSKQDRSGNQDSRSRDNSRESKGKGGWRDGNRRIKAYAKDGSPIYSDLGAQLGSNSACHASAAVGFLVSACISLLLL